MPQRSQKWPSARLRRPAWRKSTGYHPHPTSACGKSVQRHNANTAAQHGQHSCHEPLTSRAREKAVAASQRVDHPLGAIDSARVSHVRIKAARGGRAQSSIPCGPACRAVVHATQRGIGHR